MLVLGLVCIRSRILRSFARLTADAGAFQSRYPINFVVKHPNPLFRREGPALRLMKPAANPKIAQPASRLKSPSVDDRGSDLDAAECEFGGADRDRTGDPLLAKQVLSQLSYSPTGCG